MNKKVILKEQDEEIERLHEELEDLRDDYSNLVSDYQKRCNELYQLKKPGLVTPAAKRKRQFAGSFCFDFWPLSDWFRLSLHRWGGGRYFQLTFGPIRIDFFES